MVGFGGLEVRTRGQGRVGVGWGVDPRVEWLSGWRMELIARVSICVGGVEGPTEYIRRMEYHLK